VSVVPTHWKGCIPQGKVFDLLASPPIPYFSHLERSHSGLVHTLGKGAYRKIPGVRISLSPPVYQIAILPLQPQAVLDPPVLYQNFNIMMNIISKLAQKPTDKAIRITRIVFALIILATILFGWGVTRTEFWLPDWVRYSLFVFPAIGLIRGILDPGIFRKKIWKWTVFGLGIVMILISLFMIEDQAVITHPISPTNTGTIDLANVGSTPNISVPFSVSTDNWFVFYGFILIIMGLLLNGKNITLKNERYGEIVKKIRV
jgi:hypothetical protein